MSSVEHSTDTAKKLKSLWADRRSFKKRLFLAFLPMFAAVFTFLFFGPLEIVAFSSDSLSYTYMDVLSVLIVGAVVALIGGTFLLMLLRGKIFNYAVSSVFALTVAGYLQDIVLNGSLGTLTGDAVAWQDKAKAALVNLFVWIVCIIAVFLIMHLHRKIWAGIVKWVAVALAIMQIVPTVGIVTGQYSQAKIKNIKNYILSTEEMYEYSRKDNVFLFILDTMDYKYIQQILDEDPTFLDGLDGFTSYTNATSLYARTTPSVASILSGSDLVACEMKPSDYYKDAWTSDGNDSLKTISDCGYKIDIYSKMGYTFSDPARLKYVSNSASDKGSFKYLSLYKCLTGLSLYRYSPTVLKPFFWGDTSYFNDVYNEFTLTPYVFNDSVYLTKFSSAEAVDSDKNFKVYHFFGSHPPHTLDESGEKSAEVTNAVQQTKGCLTKLLAAFERMKELGIYDDAAIIVTADHGEHPYLTRVLDHKITIGLFYKPSGSRGTPLEYSNAPVSTDNIIPTVIKAVGGDSKSFGKALDEVGEDDVVTRYHYCPLLNSNQIEKAHTAFKIIGDANDFNNWTYLGTMDIVEPY